MLPPRLKEVRDRLERKSSSGRTAREAELLEELKILDGLPALQKSVLTEQQLSARIVSGPRESCNCCGRAL